METTAVGASLPASDPSSTSIRRAEDVRETPTRGRPVGGGGEDGSESSGKTNATSDQVDLTTPNANGLEEVPGRVQEAVDKFLKTNSSVLSFEMDKDIRQVIVKVLDPQTHEVLKQYPPDEIVKMAKSLKAARGLLLDERI